MQRNFSSRVLLAALLLSEAAHAAPTIKDALDSAWARHPAAQSRAAHLDENSARRDLASSWLADAPRVSIGQKTDRWNQNAGAREWEAEIAVPLQLPGLRAARGTVAASELTQYDARTAAEKWRLAGEVREAYWQARIAAGDLLLAERKVADARLLSADAERRFRAGDIARTDWNQAEGALKLAQSAHADLRAKAYRAERAFFGLTAVSQIPADQESLAGSGAALDHHPQLLEQMRDADTARARQQEEHAARRDPPELSLGTVRERSAFGESSTGSVMLRLTVPLASGARNRSRLAAASAGRIEAEARVLQARARIEADIAAAAEEVAQSTQQVEFAAARFALSRESHELLDKSYRLGDLDLPARLRAEADRFDAELSLSRARLERSRNISRFNQANGLLP